jgi:hypothetical protein
MAETWPLTLPQSPLSGTWSSQAQDNRLNGPADVGEGEVGLRTTSTSEIVSLSMLMTIAQVQTLRSFYRTTLGHGVLRFNFDHPVLGVPKEFRFREPFQVEDAGKFQRVSMSWIMKAE